MNGLPKGWEVITLGDCLLSVIGGGTPSRKNKEYFHGDIPWFTVKDMKSLKPHDAEEHISTKAISESATNLVPAHTVIIATRIALGKVIRPTVACAINQDLKALYTGTGVNPDFLLYWVIANAREIQEKGSGTTVSGIRLETLNGLSLNLPPAAEQTRIVAKLEELLSDLDAGVAELKAAQKKLVQYRQSLLKAAVEGKLTRHWREQYCAPSPQPLSHQGRGALGVDGVNDAAANYRPHLSGQNATLREQPPEFSNPPPSATLPSPLVGEGPGERGREALETGAQLLARILKQRRANWEAKQLAKFQQQGKAPPKGWQDKYPEPVKPDTGDLPELPEGWVWATLSQVGWLDRGKSQHRPRNAPHLYGGPYPFVQTGDIRHSDTFISGVEATYSEAGLAQSKLWPAGTMCITIAANIGKTAILRMEACFPDSVVGFLSGTNEVSIRYIEYFMRSVQQKLEDEAPATAQKNINLEILGKVVLPLPPIREQEYIVECLDGLLNAAAEKNHSIDLALKQSAAQRQNILRAAFSGQLVPQNPNDEPASVLLERIRAERAARQAAKAPKKRSTKTAS